MKDTIIKIIARIVEVLGVFLMGMSSGSNSARAKDLKKRVSDVTIADREHAKINEEEYKQSNKLQGIRNKTNNMSTDELKSICTRKEGDNE